MNKIIEPDRIALLPHDKRGYPIPWNVVRGPDGTAFFTVNNDQKNWRALREELCPICGERLGKWKWFVGGPLSAFDPDGWYVDLPGHLECVEYALQVCPFLAAPKYLGRIDVVNPEALPPEARLLIDQTQIPERPTVFVAVAATKIEVGQSNGILVPHIRPARPLLHWTYWRHGQQISEAEAMPLLPPWVVVPETRKE